jgi:hypothetical protein
VFKLLAVFNLKLINSFNILKTLFNLRAIYYIYISLY